MPEKTSTNVTLELTEEALQFLQNKEGCNLDLKMSIFINKIAEYANNKDKVKEELWPLWQSLRNLK